MSTFTDTVLSPKIMRQRQPGTDYNNDNTVIALYNLLAWFRGDVRIVQSPAISLGASLTTNFNIEPPDMNEEWEILDVEVSDVNAISLADQIVFTMTDGPANLIVDLQQGSLQLNAARAWNTTTFPNRIANNTVNATIPPGALIVRKKDNKTSWMYLQVTIVTGVVVGTRSFIVTTLYRRRPVN